MHPVYPPRGADRDYGGLEPQDRDRWPGCLVPAKKTSMECPFPVISQVSRDLLCPRPTGVVRHAGDLHALRGDVDCEEDVVPDEACECEYLDGEGIDGCDASEVRLYEGLAGHLSNSRALAIGPATTPRRGRPVLQSRPV